MKKDEPVPPRWAITLLRTICPAKSFEEIEGDLVQKFYRDQNRFGLKRAKREFIWNVLRYIRPEIILRNHFSFELNPLVMLLNYLQITLRNLLKQNTLAFIHIFGLSVGNGSF